MALSMAWHMAALQRQKRLPRHDSLVRTRSKTTQSHRPEDMMSVAMQWHRAINAKQGG